MWHIIWALIENKSEKGYGVSINQGKDKKKHFAPELQAHKINSEIHSHKSLLESVQQFILRYFKN